MDKKVKYQSQHLMEQIDGTIDKFISKCKVDSDQMLEYASNSQEQID